MLLVRSVKHGIGSRRSSGSGADCWKSLDFADIRSAMIRIPTRSRLRLLGSGTVLLLTLPACLPPGERARLIQQNEGLRRENERLQRAVAQRNGTVAALYAQIENLQGFGPDRPADLFAPVKLEIASLTGGANFDDKPGDDGVTVYLRLRDADGDTVKSPGQISVQLLDNTHLEKPRVLGVYRIDDPERVRKAWYGKFGTQHYTLKCPFPPETDVPETGKVDVKVKFVDFLTGAVLTSMKEVTVNPTRNRESEPRP